MILLNEHPHSQYKYPESKYGISQIIPSKFEFKQYNECAKCDSLFESKPGKGLCPQCRIPFLDSETMYLSLAAQLRAQMVQNSKYLIQDHSRSENVICDVNDGKMYQNFPKNYLPLTLNTDGVSVYKTGSKSVWPILIRSEYLPLKLRMRSDNIILVGIYFGKKPNMKRLLHPFVEEMEQLFEQGISILINGSLYAFRPIICMCAVDLLVPAKHALLNFIYYNGYHGCAICEHPGVQIVCKNGRLAPRFVFEETPSPIRSADETLIIMSNRNIKSLPLKGVKGPVDYTHGSCLGAVPRMISIWLNPANRNERFYLNSSKIEIVNKRLAAIKPCSYIRRRPDNIAKFDSFKGHQVKSFFPHYFLPCFKNILPSEYLMHAQLLFSTLYTLLSEEITQEQLQKASNDLEEFVRKFELMYGEENMVVNIHNLLHLVWSVQNWGPLWSQSTFSFEQMNGVLARFVNGSRHPLHQICTKYTIDRSLRPSNVRNSATIKSVITTPNLNEQEIEALESNGIDATNIICYCRAIVNNVTYSSCAYKKFKFVDYFVDIEDNGECIISKIKFFFQNGDEDFCVIEKYNVESIVDQYRYIKTSKSTDIFPINLIKTKLMYIRVEGIFEPIEVVIAKPNDYELE